MIIIGWPIFMISSVFALLVSPPIYILAIIGAVLLGAGLGWLGYIHWSTNDLIAE